MGINPEEFENLQNSLIDDGTIQKREFGNCVQGDKIFVQESEYPMSRKKVESLKEIAWMQKYYQCNPIRFIKDFFNIELLDAQAWLVQQSWTCKNVLWVCSRGLGKAEALDTRIPTPDGDKTIADIKVGDYVFGDDGKPTKVINTSPIYYNHDCYKITFSDGEEIIADADHLWQTYLYGKPKVVETSEISKDFKHYRDRADKSKNGYEYLYKVDICKPLEYPEKDLPIDPYILGLWLGDGFAEDGHITVWIKDVPEIVRLIEETGYKVHSITNDSRGNKKVLIHTPTDVSLTSVLKENNLCKNKHIPEEYKYSSIEQRLALVQGLMDTDGTISKVGTGCSFVQSEAHKNIIDSLEWILDSLGIKSKVYVKNKKCNGKSFSCREIYFNSSKEFPVFRMQRKYNRLREHPIKKSYHKSIIDIKKVDTVPTKCLMVDNDSHLFLCGNKNTITHNSTVVDLIIMAKDMLFNNYWTYIASGSGSQAETTFTTLERLANDNIDSFMGSTGSVFKAEVEIKNANGDGFSHSSDGFNYSTYNGSTTKTLNSNVDKKRGSRGSVIFDECGFLSEEMMNVYGAFAVVNKSFKSGTDGNGKILDPVRLRTIPKEIPYQLFYISSASSTDTKFYEYFKEFSKKMFIGRRDYFVALIPSDVPLHPTIHGKLMNPLYEKSVIENELKTNPEKARREYYCQFTTDAGSDAIIKRSVITRNEEVRKPLLYNDTGDKKFIITYDPARSRDNSIILVGEVYDYEQVNGTIDKRMRLVNCISLVDVGKKEKTPMRTPEQVEYLKRIILAYNGDADNYGNILGVYIDAGSGGGGVNIADYLMPDWTDAQGMVHRGLIDKEYSADYVKRFPNAVDKIRIMSPAAYKSDMYEALIELATQDKIKFTASYDNRDYLTVFDVSDEDLKAERKRISEELRKQHLDEKEFEKQLNDQLLAYESASTRSVKLEWEDKLALSNIDALKEELVNIVRKKRDSGKDSFDLTPEKAQKMHDDRAYTACLAAYGLMLERRKEYMNRKSEKKKSYDEILRIRAPKLTRTY